MGKFILATEILPSLDLENQNVLVEGLEITMLNKFSTDQIHPNIREPQV